VLLPTCTLIVPISVNPRSVAGTRCLRPSFETAATAVKRRSMQPARARWTRVWIADLRVAQGYGGNHDAGRARDLYLNRLSSCFPGQPS